MAIDIWPISAMAFPISQTIEIEGIINSYGDGQEQRVNTGLPRVRADGQGGVTNHIGLKSFSVKISRLQYLTNPVAGNSNLDNSVKELWNFFIKQFYDSVTNQPKWDSFYWYNPVENDDFSTWTGDSVSAGTNSRGEAVTEKTGRYRVRFASQSLTFDQLRYCIFDLGIDLVEVVA